MDAAEAPPNNTATSEKVRDEELEAIKKRESRRANTFQLVACFVACTSVVGPAMGLGYSAVALGPLASADSGIEVTPATKSWIASITAIATPIGCMLSSLSMRRGRRFAMLSTSAVSAIAWLSIYFASNVTHVLIGRAISGVAIGLSSVPATVYAAEIAGPKLRGIVVTWTSVAIAIGILVIYTLGYLLEDNWRLMALVSSAFPVFSMILVLLKMPESPAWLRSKGRTDESETALRKFQGLKGGETGSEKPAVESCAAQKSVSGLSNIFALSNFKPFSIMVGYFFFQQFSGTFVVIYYAVDITLEAGVRIDGNLAAILIGFARLLGTIFVSYACRKLGRRLPSILSGAGMALSMGILSAYSWAVSTGWKIDDNGWIPVISIVTYILASTLGFLVLPFAMIGELYPARVKDIFSGLTTCLAYVFSFVALKVYPDMLNAFGKHGVFLFYAILSLFGTIFVLLFLPETKGKTLQQIEESFKSKKSVKELQNG